MTVKQILTISEALLMQAKENAINEEHKNAADSALNKVVYVMTDDRAILNGMDLVDAERRFDNVLSMVDSRVNKQEAHLIDWLHTILVNICMLERNGIINVL